MDNILDIIPYAVDTAPPTETDHIGYLMEKMMEMTTGVSTPKKSMVINIKKARRIVESRNKRIVQASLGLAGDWNFNSDIYYDGKDYHIYRAHGRSDWATPSLYIEYIDNTTETYAVYFIEEDMNEQ